MGPYESSFKSAQAKNGRFSRGCNIFIKMVNIGFKIIGDSTVTRRDREANFTLIGKVTLGQQLSELRGNLVKDVK